VSTVNKDKAAIERLGIGVFMSSLLAADHAS
jgi:hypothetical protein